MALFDASDVLIYVVMSFDISPVEGFSETMFSHVWTPIGKVVLEFNEPISGAFDLLLILILLRRIT